MLIAGIQILEPSLAASQEEDSEEKVLDPRHSDVGAGSPKQWLNELCHNVRF